MDKKQTFSLWYVLAALVGLALNLGGQALDVDASLPAALARLQRQPAQGLLSAAEITEPEVLKRHARHWQTDIT